MTESTSRRPAYARPLNHAVRILVVHDHSEQELRRKLTVPIMGKNSLEEIDVMAENYERVIAWCHEHGYPDDSRFVARLIVSHSRRGHGLVRIRQKLNQKGIPRGAAEKVMREHDIDQCILVCDQATRKYDESLPAVFSERVKIRRFLLYRDCLMEDIHDT